MSNFQDRKSARIAAMRAGITYEFQVVCDYYYVPPGVDRIVGTFESRKAAKEFAHKQLNAWGTTAAIKVIAARWPRLSHMPNGLSFSVQRIERAAK